VGQSLQQRLLPGNAREGFELPFLGVGVFHPGHRPAETVGASAGQLALQAQAVFVVYFEELQGAQLQDLLQGGVLPCQGVPAEVAGQGGLEGAPLGAGQAVADEPGEIRLVHRRLDPDGFPQEIRQGEVQERTAFLGRKKRGRARGKQTDQQQGSNHRSRCVHYSFPVAIIGKFLRLKSDCIPARPGLQ
jgi:hypothetical protein